MLTLWSGRVECLWEESLPVEVKQLPEDLAALDRVLSDPRLLGPILVRFRREFRETGRVGLTDGRPRIAMETYIRLMVLKARYRGGYRSLVAEVSDSIHLRRFCRISLAERVPDESTVRKLTRRMGPETVSNMTRMLILTATRERRFRPRAVRIDSTVVEADIKYPTDSGLASHGVRALAREGRKLAQRIGGQGGRGGGRSRGRGWRVRGVRRRAGAAGAGSLASDGSAVAGDPPALRGGQGRGAQAHGADRRAVGALGQGGQATGEGDAVQGAWARREGEAARGGQARGVGGSLREGRVPDQAAGRGRGDHRPVGVTLRSRRETDPQGEDRQAEPRPIPRLCRYRSLGGGQCAAFAAVLGVGASGFVGIVPWPD